MNYRHAFHAGNFADLVKHAALLALLQRLTAERQPLAVVDTHAGRGLYDLGSEDSRRSGEAEAGILQLMKATPPPPGFEGLMAAVRQLNGEGPIRRYPGSPWLIAAALRPGDSYLGCELRADEHEALRAALQGRVGVRTVNADGYAAAVDEARRPSRGARSLLLIDPPFEQPDDYRKIVSTLSVVRRQDPLVTALVWLPIKDLETLDAFLRDLEDDVGGEMTVAECRMRPLTDPMKMNGCALVQLGGPDIRGELERICAWTASTLGAGGLGRVYQLTAT